MTPPDHLLVGLSCANILYSAQAIFKKDILSYAKVIVVLALVAISPDIDSFFGAYTSRDPYIGHRGMTHSFLGVLALSFIIVVLSGVISVIIRVISGYYRYLIHFFKKRDGYMKSDFVFWKFILYPFSWKPFFLLFLFAFLAGVSHLIIDLPQPVTHWKGIPLWFPLKAGGDYIRNGEYAYIGWYDLNITWILIGTTVISFGMVIFTKFIKLIQMRYIYIPLFSIIILFNAGVLYWMHGHIKSSTYRGETAWYNQQMKDIKKFPKKIQIITKKGFVIFLSLYRQSVR